MSIRHIPRRDRGCWGPVRAHSSWRGVADLRVWGKMRATFHPRGWSRSLNHFNRVVVLSGPVSTTFVALLLQNLLGFGISKAQKQLHPIVLGDIVKFHQDLFGNITVFEAINKVKPSVRASHESQAIWAILPCEAHFLAHTCLLIATDFLRNNTPRLEMTTQVLTKLFELN